MAVATIATNVTAKTDKFVKGMAKAGKSTKKFGKGIGGLKKMLVGLGAVIGAGVVVRGVQRMVKGQLQAIDTTTKFADKIGISVEQLTRLQHAGELSGVSAGNLSTGLQRMTRRVAEAAQGSKGLVQGLADLGLRAENLIKLSPDQQFLAIAGAMAKIDSQSEKVRLTFKFFDTEGVGLVNTMKLITDTAGGAMREADKLGLVFSRFDAKKIEAANDAMLRLKAITTGVARILTIELAPGIAAIATGMVEWATAGGGIGEKIKNALIPVLKVFSAISVGIGLIKGGFQSLSGVIGIAMGLALGPISMLVTGVNKIGEVIAKVTGKTFTPVLTTLAGISGGFLKVGKDEFLKGLNTSKDALIGQNVFDKMIAGLRSPGGGLGGGGGMSNADAFEALTGMSSGGGLTRRRGRRQKRERTLANSPRYQAFLKQKALEMAQQGYIGTALTGQSGGGPFTGREIAFLAQEFAGVRQGKKFGQLVKHGPGAFADMERRQLAKRRVMGGTDFAKFMDDPTGSKKAGGAVRGASDIRPISVRDPITHNLLKDTNTLLGDFSAKTV